MLAASENTAKANKLLISKSILVMFPEKKRGAKTKKFFTHCSTRSSFKYFVIRIKEYHKISDFKIKKSAEADLNIMILIWSFYWPEFASLIISSFAVIANSTRRFSALPASVSLEATGSFSPTPIVNILPAETP